MALFKLITESFKYFPIIRELELSLNAVRGIQIQAGDFPNLEVCDCWIVVGLMTEAVYGITGSNQEL